MTKQHPNYIYRGGGMMDHPPFEQQDTRFYGFFAKGDAGKMQATVDREINAVAGDACYFKVISDHVMLTFADIQRSYSTYPVDYEKGYGNEIDVCFWIPVGKVVTENGRQCVHEIFWYCDFIWVNSPIAMVVGRNIYGYPKTMGQFKFPDEDEPNHFNLKVNSFKEFSPQTKAEWNQLLSVDKVSGEDGADSRWETYVDALKGIWDLVDDGLFDPGLHATEQMLSMLLQPEMPQLFLKQFPDERGQKAVYQALVSAPAKVNSFSGGGLLRGDYELTLEQVDSVPLVDDLGLVLGPQTLTLGFWLDYGFSVSDGKVLVNNTFIPPKQKVAILGGGVSACVTAFAMTDQPDWQNQYDITLYQQGWRIGGKGASGRNHELGERIEEHGLHVWFGFYENAFQVIQKAYKELDRPEGAALQTWEDAFKPHDYVVWMEHIADEWKVWGIDFPKNNDLPGEGDAVLDAWQFIEMMYVWLKKAVGDLSDEIERVEAGRVRSRPHANFFERLTSIADRIEDEVEDAVEDVLKLVGGLTQFVASLPKSLEEHKDADHSFLDHVLDDIKEWLEDIVEGFLDESDELRRLYIGVDMALAILTGMHRDKIFKRGFNVINDLDLRQWLANNGANEEYTVNSAPIRAVYDLVFAYKDGDIAKPDLEAGTALRGMLLLVWGYKGSIMWKMQAGMGDTIFTPFYQVLKRRGVKFKFFHQVESLSLVPHDPGSVGKVTMVKQVELHAGADHYEPLVNVKGLACWPSAPIYDQLLPETAALLQQNNIDLECFWSDWPEIYEAHYQRPLPKLELEKGKDFDLIVCGISVASLPHLCADLLAHSEPLRKTVASLNTVATQAYQLWTTDTLRELGWDHYPPSGQEPILTAFTEPVDTWAAMNQLLIREDWQQYPTEPQNCAYFCGVQPFDHYPPVEDHDFPKQAREQVKKNCIAQLNQDIKSLWPDSAGAEGFHWQLLYDNSQQVGEQRFSSQYWRSNVSPSERYVQSTVNSTQFRIEPDGAGFGNLVFTGDWISNGLNVGCVEASAIAGLKASRAICGYPKKIAGEGSLW